MSFVCIGEISRFVEYDNAVFCHGQHQALYERLFRFRNVRADCTFPFAIYCLQYGGCCLPFFGKEQADSPAVVWIRYLLYIPGIFEFFYCPRNGAFVEMEMPDKGFLRDILFFIEQHQNRELAKCQSERFEPVIEKNKPAAVDDGDDCSKRYPFAGTAFSMHQNILSAYGINVVSATIAGLPVFFLFPNDSSKKWNLNTLPSFLPLQKERMVLMQKIPLEVHSEDSGIRFRDCFSVRYIQSAALLCRLGHEIEAEYLTTGALTSDLLISHEAFILNAIFSSVAFLESTVNELYSDAADNAYFLADKNNEALLRTIGEKWNNENYFDRTPTLVKYQKILEIAGQPQFDEQDPVFSDVRDLTEMRNYLMHYRREWVLVTPGESDDGRRESQADKFKIKFRDRFSENPLANKNLPYFPDRCFGHGCAEWAVKSCLLFTDEFFRRLKFPPPYEGIKDDLVTRMQ